RLLADDHDLRVFLEDDRFQQLGDGERLQLGIGLYEDSAIGTHRQRRADRLLALRHPERYCDNLLDSAGLAQTKRLFDGDLVERVHRHLDIGGLDPGLVRLDADLDVVVDYPFDRDQRLHLALAIATAVSHGPPPLAMICPRPL